MSARKLHRQQSSISAQFDVMAPRYFCCFGYCHAKTIGILIFFFEIVSLITSSAFLFLKSATYTTDEWKSLPVLSLVAAALIFLVLLAITTALLFMGVCYEESYLVIPYMVRQILYILTIVIVCVFRPNWICEALPLATLQTVLLFLALGTYRYLRDIQLAIHYKPSSIDHSSNATTYSSSASRMASHKNRKLSRGRFNHHNRPATIDLC